MKKIVGWVILMMIFATHPTYANLWERESNESMGLHFARLESGYLYLECDIEEHTVVFFYFDKNKRYFPLADLEGVKEDGTKLAIHFGEVQSTFKDVVNFFDNVESYSFHLDGVRKPVKVENNEGSGSLSGDYDCSSDSIVYAAMPEGL